MEYIFKRSFLLLLTVGAIFNTRVQGTLIEPMAPRTVKVCIGSHITINCTFHPDAKRLKVQWFHLYNTSNINDSKKIEFNSSTGSSHYNEEKGSSASYLTIRNVTFNDRGGYFCEVTKDIPQIITEKSNVTHLVICLPTESNLECNTTNSPTTCVPETPNASPWWLSIPLAVGCALTLTTVIITILICRRKKEAPVYENTKEASWRCWKEDKSLHHCKPSKGYSNKQMDTLKPHKYDSHPKGREGSPKF